MKKLNPILLAIVLIGTMFFLAPKAHSGTYPVDDGSFLLDGTTTHSDDDDPDCCYAPDAWMLVWALIMDSVGI